MHLISILIVALAAIVGVLFLAFRCARPTVIAANEAGRHTTGNLTRFAEGALSTRYILVKKGTAEDEIQACGASNIPLGVLTDETEADRDPANIQLLGCGQGTTLMVASEAIGVGVFVYTAASGKVSLLSASAGTYYLVGTALTAASADGDVIEVAHCHPRATVVS